MDNYTWRERKDRDSKMLLVTEYIFGCAFASEYGIRYVNSHYIDEELIQYFARTLKNARSITQDQNWVSLLERSVIDEIIDEREWEYSGERYFYNEADRMEIMSRCAKLLCLRLKEYAGDYTLKYIIHDNGNVGFRFE